MITRNAHYCNQQLQFLLFWTIIVAGGTADESEEERRVLTLAYEERGSGMPVVLVHGFPLSSRMWRDQLAAVGTAEVGGIPDGIRLIAPDMRGFGRSPVTPGPYRMETFADDLAHFLDQLGLERAIVGGLSMGGYITFAFLRRYAHRVCGIVLANTRATADRDEVRAARETNARLVEERGPAAIADLMLPNLLAADAPPERRAYVRAIIEANSTTAIAAALRGMALRGDSTDLLATIQVPTLVIGGEADTLTPPDEIRSLHSAIPGSRLAMLPAAGHLSNLDAPEAFNAALVDFVRTHFAGT